MGRAAPAPEHYNILFEHYNILFEHYNILFDEKSISLTVEKMWMMLNLMKQGKRHDEEEGAKEQVEESLLVFSCHQRCDLP